MLLLLVVRCYYSVVRLYPSSFFYFFEFFYFLLLILFFSSFFQWISVKALSSELDKEKKMCVFFAFFFCIRFSNYVLFWVDFRHEMEGCDCTVVFFLFFFRLEFFYLFTFCSYTILITLALLFILFFFDKYFILSLWLIKVLIVGPSSLKLERNFDALTMWIVDIYHHYLF